MEAHALYFFNAIINWFSFSIVIFLTIVSCVCVCVDLVSPHCYV